MRLEERETEHRMHLLGLSSQLNRNFPIHSLCMVHRGREATAPNFFIFAACPPIRTTTYGMQPPVERDLAHVLPLLWARHGLHCTTLQQARLSGTLCRIWKPDVVQRQTRRTHPLLGSERCTDWTGFL